MRTRFNYFISLCDFIIRYNKLVRSKNLNIKGHISPQNQNRLYFALRKLNPFHRSIIFMRIKLFRPQIIINVACPNLLLFQIFS